MIANPQRPRFGRRRSPTVVRVLVVFLASLASLAGPGSARAAAQEVRLAWRFEPGEVLEYLQTTSSRMGTPMGEMTNTQEVRTRLEVLRVGADGAADLRYTFAAVRTVIETPAGRQEFDSELAPDSGSGALNPMAGMVGASVEMTMAPDGEIRSLSGVDELMERVMKPLLESSPGQAAQVRAMMGELFDDERMMAQMQQGMAMLPAEPIRPGETWSREIDMALPFGSARAEYTYRIEDVVSRGGRRVAVVGMTGTMGPLQPDSANPMAGMMSFSGSETTGTLEFDADRGRLLTMRMTTVTASEAMGTPMDIEMTHRMELLEE